MEKKERDQERKIEEAKKKHDSLFLSYKELETQKQEVDLKLIDKDIDIANKTVELAGLNEKVYTLNEQQETHKAEIASLSEINTNFKTTINNLNGDLKKKDSLIDDTSVENTELEKKLKRHKILSKWRMFVYEKKIAESELELPSSANPNSPATNSSQEDYSKMTFKQINSIQDPTKRKKAVSGRLGYWRDMFKNELKLTA